MCPVHHSHPGMRCAPLGSTDINIKDIHGVNHHFSVFMFCVCVCVSVILSGCDKRLIEWNRKEREREQEILLSSVTISLSCLDYKGLWLSRSTFTAELLR